MRCLLCDKNEANQTGAHIFPAWMIASAFDSESRTRDHEIIFAMYGIDSPLPFFGNSVQSEKIMDQLGRDLTDEEISKQKNYLTVDKIWCKQCEKKVSLVEEYFLDNIDRKIKDFAFSTETEVSKFPNANNYLIRLFIYSLFFRAHLTSFMGLTLNVKASIKLKHFLNYYIQDDLKSTIEFIEKSEGKAQILKYPIRCLRIKHEKNTEGWIYLNKNHVKPYSLIINNYIIQFYGRGNQAQFKPTSLFGLSSIITSMEDCKNYKEEIFKIGLVSLKLSQSIKKNYMNYVTEIRMNRFILMFKMLFKRKFNVTPNREMTTIFLKELLENDLPLGIKYSKEMIVAALNRTVEKLNALN